MTAAFGFKTRLMLIVVQPFGKHCGCHRQGRCLPKRRIATDIRRGLNPKAAVARLTSAAKTSGQKLITRQKFFEKPSVFSLIFNAPETRSDVAVCVK